ncbi:MAG: acetolactate synthase catalytic subunit [Hyphomicrobiales bacterium]|nr:acetolactate synthase catalytic subunit [Hyphomicrobiales bacterium]
MPEGTRLSNATVADRIASAFTRHGVTVTFGQSIPTAFHLSAVHFGIKQAAYRTENAGGAMADAYARISNRVSVVTAQNGPAATLLVPPLAEALKASVPVIALVQEVPRSQADKNAFQEFDHVGLFNPVAKWVGRIDVPDRVDEYVDMAFVAATTGRPGPVVLLAPLDVLSLPAGSGAMRHEVYGTFPLDCMLADPVQISKAADLLAEAEAPLVVAGGGVHLSNAADALARLQQEASLPVATTLMGKGAIDERHPLSLGVIGYFMGAGSRTEKMREIVTGADVILFVGTRHNQNGTDSWTLYPDAARHIHLDIDGGEVGRNYEAMRLVGDAAPTLDALTKELKKRNLAHRNKARQSVADRIAVGMGAWRERIEGISTEDRTPIRPERLMTELDSMLTPETIVVADASYSSIWIANYLTARRPGQRFLTPRGMAGLGWGLPFAIGAQFAEPKSRVVCVSGDGGFGHVWAELEMLARHKLPVVLIVLNNQILGYQKHGETVSFDAYTDAVDFGPVDHAGIARACGIEGVRIDKPQDFLGHLRAAFESGRPTLLDVIVDEDAHPPITSFGDRFASPF